MPRYWFTPASNEIPWCLAYPRSTIGGDNGGIGLAGKAVVAIIVASTMQMKRAAMVSQANHPYNGMQTS